MKKFLILLIIFFSGTFLYGQESAALGQILAQKIQSNALKGKELAETILQYDKLIEQSKMLKTMSDTYKKVSAKLKDYSAVKNSVLNMYMTIDAYKNIITEMRNFKDANGNKVLSTDDINYFDDYMLAVIESNAKNIKDLKSIMKSDNLKMNDGERMEIAKIIEQRTASNYYRVKSLEDIFN